MNYWKYLLVLHISYKCNERCIFCSEDWRMKAFSWKFVNKSTIFFLLKKWYKKWVKQVHFTGWEPFLHPNILDILKFAKSLGYNTYILTNWTLLADEDMFIKVIKYIDWIDLSVHWHNQQLCDRLTRYKDNYFKLINLFNLIQKYDLGNKIFIDNVVLKENINFLNKVYKLVISYFKPKFYMFSYLAPEGQGVNIFSKQAVDFNTFNKVLKQIFEFDDWIKKIIVWVPLCELDDDIKNYSNDLYFSPRITIEIDKVIEWQIYLREVLTKRPIRNRKYVDKCRDCKFKKICWGYPILYKIK